MAIVAGTLARGGAEKQLVYLVRALHGAGHLVRVYCLTRAEHYEPVLSDLGVKPVWIGRFGNPMARTLALVSALRAFEPHIIQSSHFYTNLYVALAAPVLGAIGIGTARSDVVHEVSANGRWGKWLLRMPSSLVVNSHAARRNAIRFGVAAEAIQVLSNVIDLGAFDDRAASPAQAELALEEPVVMAVGSLVGAKRFDRFLRALALARSRGVRVSGALVGDGPERARLESLARQLGLTAPALIFSGASDHVPALLRRAGMFMLTSEHEGFPNVILEAMAAGLPVITTAAGDAGVVVRHGETGFVVDGDDIDGLATRLVELVVAPELRCALGTAGRRRVEAEYTMDGLAGRVFAVYRVLAERAEHHRTLAVLSGVSHGGSLATNEEERVVPH